MPSHCSSPAEPCPKCSPGCNHQHQQAQSSSLALPPPFTRGEVQATLLRLAFESHLCALAAASLPDPLRVTRGTNSPNAFVRGINSFLLHHLCHKGEDAMNQPPGAGEGWRGPPGHQQNHSDGSNQPQVSRPFGNYQYVHPPSWSQAHCRFCLAGIMDFLTLVVSL